MSLSERSRTRIYQALQPLVGEEAVGEMLSYFPARDVEEPVTKEFLRAELAEFRTEMRTELAKFGTDLRSEIAAMGAAHHRDQRQTLTWMMSTIVGTAALVIAAVTALG